MGLPLEAQSVSAGRGLAMNCLTVRDKDRQSVGESWSRVRGHTHVGR